MTAVPRAGHPGAEGEARARRLDPGALPEGLTHEPSRRFLVEEGLPLAAAELEFTGIRDGRCGTPATRGAGARMLVLGESAQDDARLVLDGARGTVLLVAGEGDEARHDLIASSLPQLAKMAQEIEAVSRSPRQEPVGEERRGLAVLAEVRSDAEGRLRRIDPEVYARGLASRAGAPGAGAAVGGGDGSGSESGSVGDGSDEGAGRGGAAAHWSTALLLRTLHWAARPGGPGELAYALEPGLVAEAAEDGRVRRFEDWELPRSLTHGPTRRLLTEVGLPYDADLFALQDGPLDTMAEVHLDCFPEQANPATGAARTAVLPYTRRGSQRDFLAVGWWALDLAVALDGTTGRVELPDWYDEGSPARYLHQDLSALLYACWTYKRIRTEWERWDPHAGGQPGPWRVFCPRRPLAHRVADLIKAVDPPAFATSDHSWQHLAAARNHTGGLL
ncbi:SUKH-4 family immunity protein [Streptomyces sp. NBC_01795]|uniref:SUKH-4 family immunity protein n=1 Tax=Streptomyces sp. NBC_01795 TaxID=2975943 RepID=UPI002DDA3AD5|nr:SUKH-4 family immunity protein [Streptomyces sp. NBC_01795]WSA96022.1 SUKH-4 family immunity protein [Streptomyces sp. NBC_01795]